MGKAGREGQTRCVGGTAENLSAAGAACGM